MDQWTYNEKSFESEDIGNYVGFVYLITDVSNGKKYVGKKNFWSTRRLPPLKGKTRKRTVKKESDWKDYFGSSEQVKLLVESHGRDNFKREILYLCNTKGEMSYLEAKEQFDRNVLFSDEYYNEFIGCKIHAKHVKGIQNV
jgi:hypothetical protein